MNDIHGDNGRLGNPRGIGDLLDVAVERAVPVVRALPDGCLEAATPCAEFDVKALVNHLFQVMEQFQRLAAKQDSDFTETADRVAEGPDWRERFGEEARKLVAAWSAPGAEEGTTGAMNMPAATVGSMVLLDLTVHIWDLARATGQEYVPEGRRSPSWSGWPGPSRSWRRRLGRWGCSGRRCRSPRGRRRSSGCSRRPGGIRGGRRR